MIEKDTCVKPYLCSAASTGAVLKRYGFTAVKKYGQNFLIDQHVANKIVSAADISSDDLVIEIGPGIGTLTQYLASRAGKVIALEIDKKLIPILEDTLRFWDNVTVINADILKFDLEAILDGRFEGVKLVANLPYYITTPIIMGILEKRLPIDKMVLMMQREVARRIAASPGSKEYGALSITAGYYAEAYLEANVPQNCFFPRPQVSSAVISLKKRKYPVVEVADERLFFGLVRAAFSQRRKMLVNAVANSHELSITRDEISAAVLKCGLDLRVRGEALDIEKFAELANALLGDAD